MNDQGLNSLRPRILHTAYYVQDLQRSVDFYVQVLGMREDLRIPLPGGELEAVLSFPDSKGSGVILMSKPSRDKPYDRGDGYSRLVLKISDLSAAIAHVGAHGVQLTSGPKDGPNGMRYALFADPDGYVIELLQFGAKP